MPSAHLGGFMPYHPKILLLAVLALLAFAGNSILCRLALAQGLIDPMSFTFIRLLSGACVLALLVWKPSAGGLLKGATINYKAGCYLFIYAAGFSYAYVRLDAGEGALMLFGAVQLTILGSAATQGEQIPKLKWLGSIIAIGGLAILVWPDEFSSGLYSLLMIVAGIAWAAYTLVGKQSADPVASTAHNFIFSLVPASLMFLGYILLRQPVVIYFEGVLWAAVSGAITSALGYVIWYQVLPHLSRITAASIQLLVPVLAVLGGVALLSESISVRFLIATMTILIGLILVLFFPRHRHQV